MQRVAPRFGRFVVRATSAAALAALLAGCGLSDAAKFAAVPNDSIIGAVRDADLSVKSQPHGGNTASRPADRSLGPQLYPGSDSEFTTANNESDEQTQPSEFGGRTRVAASDAGATVGSSGVEINFEAADIQTVAKTLLGDVLDMTYVVDPRVQGQVTFASSGPIPRKDVLPVFESVLRMSNAAIVRDGPVVKIVPVGDANGSGTVTLGAGNAGFGVAVVPLKYITAGAVAKMAENFISRPNAVRVDTARNIVLVQGTMAERLAVVDVLSTFDVEWLKNQSVGVYPLKATSPEIMIGELERIFETKDGERGAGLVKFQPITRMNAVMVVTKNRKFLNETTQWIQRLDRSDSAGTSLRIYRVRYGNAQQVAAILNDIFVGGGRGSSSGSAFDGLTPGSRGNRGGLDAFGNSGSNFGSGAGSGGPATSPSNPGPGSSSGTTAGNRNSAINASFEALNQNQNQNNANRTSFGGGANAVKGLFEGVRITADTANNAIVIYANQEDYRVITTALREIDRPPLQVAIEATIAEVTLTNQLNYGVQFFFQDRADNGSIGLANNGKVAPPINPLTQVAPGLNLLFGPQNQPRVLLSALSAITDVKVLSSPSLVVLDNQPAILQVGDQVPVTTQSATLVGTNGAPIVNSVEFRDTGVILKVLPRVSSNGAVRLDIEQEISNVVNPTADPNLTPTISQRRVRSTVSVNSGQTVMLGGLISERHEKDKSGLPGVSQIKFLGDIFGTTTNNSARTELIIFIKPRVIKNPMDARAVTEEFRDRLLSMRQSNTVIRGDEVAPPRPAGPPAVYK